MKYLLSIVFAFLVSFHVTAQDRFKVTIGSGIGSYRMDDLKRLQENFRGNVGLLETVDNFPMYFFYSGELSYNVGDNVGLGLIYRLQSTGASNAYSDYSGIYTLEQRLIANCAGVLFDFNLWKKNKLKLSSQIRTYYGWTNLELSEYLRIYSIDSDLVDFKADFKSKSVMANPDVTVGYKILDQVFLNFSVGYCIDFEGDLKDHSGNYIPDAYGNPVQSNWSGIRLGLSASCKF